MRSQHHDAKVSRIDAGVARGDRRLADALELACKEGFLFDSWDEFFNYDKWLSVFERTGIDPAFYANRTFGENEILPWDIIDCGVSKEFFLRERKKAYGEETTPNCREKCSACGANKLGGVRAVCPGCPTAPKSEPAVADTILSTPVWNKLETPKTVRILFRKVGDLQYISHLDLQRTISRVLVRAQIPMWYTQGFNPHAKVVFGLPLSVGTESECEFIDLRIDRDISCREVKDRLNRELTNEMQILEAYEPTTKFQDIGWANYEIEISTPKASPELAARLQALYTGGNLIMTKKTKSGDKEIDISPMIRHIKVTCDTQRKNALHVSAVLSAGSADHLNPEMLIKLARTHCGILSEDNVGELYSILRTKVFLADGKTEFR